VGDLLNFYQRNTAFSAVTNLVTYRRMSRFDISTTMLRSKWQYVWLLGLVVGAFSFADIDDDGTCARIVSGAQLELSAPDRRDLHTGSRVRVLSAGKVVLDDVHFLAVIVLPDGSPWQILFYSAKSETTHYMPALRAVFSNLDGNQGGFESLKWSPPIVVKPFSRYAEDSCVAAGVLHSLVSLKGQKAAVPILNGVESSREFESIYQKLVGSLNGLEVTSGADQDEAIEKVFSEQGIHASEVKSHFQWEFQEQAIEKLRAHLRHGGVVLTEYLGSVESCSVREANHFTGELKSVTVRVVKPQSKGDIKHLVTAQGLFEIDGKEFVLVFEPNAARYVVRTFDWLAFGDCRTERPMGSRHRLLSPKISQNSSK